MLEAEVLGYVEYRYSSRGKKSPKCCILEHFDSVGVSTEQVSLAFSVLKKMGLIKEEKFCYLPTEYALQAIANHAIRTILNPWKKTIHKMAVPLGEELFPTPKGILSEDFGYTKAEVEKLFGGKWRLCHRAGKLITVFEENYTPQAGSKGYFRQNGSQFLRKAK